MTDDLMALADSLTQSPARQYAGGQVPSPSAAMVAGGPVQPDSEGGRAGDPPVPGEVSGFTLPKPPGLPRFGDGPPHPMPGPRPTPPPVPAPRPPFAP